MVSCRFSLFCQPIDVVLPFLKPAKSAKSSYLLGQVKAKAAKGDVASGWSQEALLSGAGGDAQDCGCPMCWLAVDQRQAPKSRLGSLG